ncbi:MAG: hypothetical protein OEW75_03485 [Cyclobacteriaceae bacterium]|nr:hypothetical protein [Cyclobacteriaceae bacterium]
MKTIFLLAVLNSLSINFHPMHISVCEMEYDETRHALEITQRVFLDDLEKEIRDEIHNAELIITDLSKKDTDLILKAYIKRHINIFVEKKEKTVRYVGHEIDRDAVFIYFEVVEVVSPKIIGIKNDVLLGTFEDQVNLVHIEKGGKLQSLKLEGEEDMGEVIFN